MNRAFGRGTVADNLLPFKALEDNTLRDRAARRDRHLRKLRLHRNSVRCRP